MIIDGQRIGWSGSARPWTELGFPGFSGTATYRTILNLRPTGRQWLDLGDVGDLARVRVNGTDCGVAWTFPFRVEITDALRDGDNDVEIEVTNAWMNRLIAEAGSPTGELFAPVTAVYEPNAPVRSAGLGRVELLSRP